MTAKNLHRRRAQVTSWPKVITHSVLSPTDWLGAHAQKSKSQQGKSSQGATGARNARVSTVPPKNAYPREVKRSRHAT